MTLKIVDHPRTSTDITLANDMKRSLIVQGVAKDAGVTFGQFVQAVKALGIQDNTPLAFIEYGVAQTGTGYLIRDDDEDPRGVGVREL